MNGAMARIPGSVPFTRSKKRTLARVADGVILNQEATPGTWVTTCLPMSDAEYKRLLLHVVLCAVEKQIKLDLLQTPRRNTHAISQRRIMNLLSPIISRPAVKSVIQQLDTYHGIVVSAAGRVVSSNIFALNQQVEQGHRSHPRALQRVCEEPRIGAQPPQQPSVANHKQPSSSVDPVQTTDATREVYVITSILVLSISPHVPAEPYFTTEHSLSTTPRCTYTCRRTTPSDGAGFSSDEVLRPYWVTSIQDSFVHATRDTETRDTHTSSVNLGQFPERETVVLMNAPAEVKSIKIYYLTANAPTREIFFSRGEIQPSIVETPDKCSFTSTPHASTHKTSLPGKHGVEQSSSATVEHMRPVKNVAHQHRTANDVATQQAPVRQANEAEQNKSVRLEKKEVDRQEVALQEAERQEAERQEAERHEAERHEAERQEAVCQETECQEAERQEAERQEAERQEAERQEAARQETERQEAERQEAERQEAERQEAERQEAARQQNSRNDHEEHLAPQGDNLGPCTFSTASIGGQPGVAAGGDYSGIWNSNTSTVPMQHLSQNRMDHSYQPQDVPSYNDGYRTYDQEKQDGYNFFQHHHNNIMSLWHIQLGRIVFVRTDHVCTRIHAYTHTRIHAYTHTRIHAYMHTRIHAYTHTRIHAYTHTRIHAHTHTHTHTLDHARAADRTI
jgi:hypothetical protein